MGFAWRRDEASAMDSLRMTATATAGLICSTTMTSMGASPDQTANWRSRSATVSISTATTMWIYQISTDCEMSLPADEHQSLAESRSCHFLYVFAHLEGAVQRRWCSVSGAGPAGPRHCGLVPVSPRFYSRALFNNSSTGLMKA
jgi:hypothetical protein